MGSVPNKQGRFGAYGGRYVPETLMPALLELEQEYARVKKDRGFQSELAYYLKHYAGRPTALYFAQRLTKRLGGAKIYLNVKISVIPGLIKLITRSDKGFWPGG